MQMARFQLHCKIPLCWRFLLDRIQLGLNACPGFESNVFTLSDSTLLKKADYFQC